jgi:hypothetical protein
MPSVKRAWVVYAGSLFAICTGTFSLGRWSRAELRSAQREETVNQSPTLVATHATGSLSSPVTNIRVAGFGAVGFAELSDLLQTVPTEQKNRWAGEIAAMPDGPQKRLAAIALFATWIQFDAAAACAALASLPDTLLRAVTIDSVAGAAPTTGLPILAETVAQLTVIERRSLLPAILRDWSTVDPAAVAQFVSRNPKTVTYREVGALISEWAEVDVAAAREWLEKDPTFSEHPEVVAALVKKWVQTDSAGATEYVRAHAASSAFSPAVAAIAPALYRAAADGARAFVDSLPLDAKQDAIGAILEFDREDPSRIAETIQWVARFPADVWTGYVGSVLASWTTQDEEVATRWLSRRPAAERERLVVELCAGGAELTPRVAALALSISDEGSRTRAVQNLLAPWSSDAAGLRRAVAALHLPRRETSYLLRAGGSPR